MRNDKNVSECKDAICNAITDYYLEYIRMMRIELSDIIRNVEDCILSEEGCKYSE